VAAFLASLADGSHKVEPGRLTWWDEHGFGYYPVDPADAPYDAAYFGKYVAMAATEMGQALNITRARMVERWWQGDLVDVGIGSGAFIEHRAPEHPARPLTFGYDVNPAAVEWLRRKRLWWNPRVDPCPAVSMWDVLEHMPDFPKLLVNVRAYAFVSIPVFGNPEYARNSRHFRPTEHFFYFTAHGFTRAMADLGWKCVEMNWNESVLGRDSIGSFAFRRVNAAP
jgi:hypothetical protein